MNNTIIERQNEEDNLLYLAAQRNLYSEAERWVQLEMIVGGFIIGASYFLLPVFLPNVFGSLNIDYSSLKPFIGFIAPLSGLIFTIIDIGYINPKINIIKEKAAKIQENFDCDVLMLPWNDIKIEHIDQEEVILNAKKYKKEEKDLSSLKMWYEEPIKKIPLQIGRFLCQRTNCWWDSNLRENFIKTLKLMGFCILVVIIIITLYESICTKELVKGISTIVYGGFSFLYYYVFLMRQINENKTSKKKIIKIKDKIDEIWQSILNSDKKLDLDILSRQIQDEIYDHRKTTPIVFDWFYRREKDKQGSSTAFSVKKAVAEYTRIKTMSNNSKNMK